MLTIFYFIVITLKSLPVSKSRQTLLQRTGMTITLQLEGTQNMVKNKRSNFDSMYSTTGTQYTLQQARIQMKTLLQLIKGDAILQDSHGCFKSSFLLS